MTQKYIIWYQNNIKNHHITNPNQQLSLYWCPHWNTMGISTPWNLMIQIRLFWITSDISWYTIITLGLWCIICSCIIIYAYNCNNICNCKVTYRTILKDYNDNPIKHHGIRVILGKWNHQYWRFVFHVVEAEGPYCMDWIQWGIALFTRHPRISTETTDIHKQQNHARCDPTVVESTTKQDAGGPAAEIQSSRPSNYTQTSTGQGYVNPRHLNNKISVSFSEGLSSAVSLQNRQLRTTLPATKLLANSETVKVSPQTRQRHSRHESHPKKLPQLIPTQPVRLQDP